MSLMTHTMPLGSRGISAQPAADAASLGSSHLAMIKRFATFTIAMTGFVVLMIAVTGVKYAAFFLHMPR